MMTLQQIAGLGRKLAAFLRLFQDCFGRSEGFALLTVYVKGQLSDLHRKTAEAIALRFGTAPQTLQRLLESINRLSAHLDFIIGEFPAASQPAAGGVAGSCRDQRP